MTEDSNAADGAKPADMYVWKLPSRVESCVHVEPLLADVTRWPPAYVLGEERIQKYPPVPQDDAVRTISAYCVPEVSVASEPKLAAKVAVLPLLSPAIVALARSLRSAGRPT